MSTKLKVYLVGVEPSERGVDQIKTYKTTAEAVARLGHINANTMNTRSSNNIIINAPLKNAVATITTSDIIVTLDGWHNNQEAITKVKIARLLQIPIIHFTNINSLALIGEVAQA